MTGKHTGKTTSQDSNKRITLKPLFSVSEEKVKKIK
jgi:hypothetical protein